VAAGDSGPDRRLAGSDHSRATGKDQSCRFDPALHAPRGSGPWTQKPVGQKGVLPLVKGIADTGYLVAFANRNDAHHDWAVGLAERVTEPLLTCEAVLAEAAFHLQSVPLVLAMISDGLVTLAFHGHEHVPQLTVLARRYADRRPDLADLCLIRMSELHPRHSILTVDRGDFRVYRRNKRETIPIICPPGVWASPTSIPPSPP